MLKASIIYYPGSGGSFLGRILSLHPNAMMGTNGQNLNEHSDRVSTADKLEKFIKWGGYNRQWKINESSTKFSYKTGANQFIDYETSPLWLVDHLHPTQFLQLESHGLWEPTNTFEKFVFITINDNDKNFLEQNQRAKSYVFEYDQEYPKFLELKERFKNNSIDIPFDCFRDRVKFLKNIQVVDQWLGFDLDLDLVKKVWTAWQEASNTVWK